MKSLSIAILATVALLLLTPALGASAANNDSEASRASVLVRLVDQAGVEIAGSQIGMGTSLVDTGDPVELALGTHTFLLRPLIPGANSTGQITRSVTAVVTAGTTLLEFEWITAEVTFRLEDQFGDPIPGSTFYLGYETYSPDGGGSRPQFAILPITDESVYPTLAGSNKAGYTHLTYPGVQGREGSRHFLKRSEGSVEVPSAGRELVHQWSTAEVTFRLEDQHGDPIPASTFSLGFEVYRPDGGSAHPQSATVPVTSYPNLTGIWATGYSLLTYPGVQGREVTQHFLRRSEGNVEIPPEGRELVRQWNTAEVTFRLEDQHGDPIPASTFSLGFEVYRPDGGSAHPQSATVPVTSYPNLTGIWATGYSLLTYPGVQGREGSRHFLKRSEGNVEIPPEGRELVRQWNTAEVTFRLEDQHGDPIPASTFSLGFEVYRPDGGSAHPQSATVPVTSYPNLTGIWATGYSLLTYPGVQGREVTQHFLRRSEGNVEIPPEGRELVRQWNTAEVTFRLEDQHGDPIPASTFSLGFEVYRPDGGSAHPQSATVPVTSYPNLTGIWATGYSLLTYPGVQGREGSRHFLKRSEGSVEMSADGLDLVYQWIILECEFHLVDSGGQNVPGSSLVYRYNTYREGDVLGLPITDNSVYPTLGGLYRLGYPVAVRPGDLTSTSATFTLEALSTGFESSELEIGGNNYQLICQSDTDADGVFDDEDNCPAIANPFQENLDGDSYGDACDDELTVDGAIGTVTSMVEDLGLVASLADDLQGKLAKALDFFQKEKSTTAANHLGAFINKVNAKRGKDISDTDADALIVAAEAIIDAINGGTADKRSALSEAIEAELPETVVLRQNYPNPFNPQTTIEFALPEAVHISLMVYDMMGRRVRVLEDGVMSAGRHTAVFEAGGLPSGNYLVRLDTPAGRFTRMVQLIK